MPQLAKLSPGARLVSTPGSGFELIGKDELLFPVFENGEICEQQRAADWPPFPFIYLKVTRDGWGQLSIPHALI